MKHKSLKLSVISIALTSLLTACGGGSSNSSSTPAFTPKAISGTAVDFYLDGAKVQFDDCLQNGTPIFVTTNADGKFDFTTTQACNKSAVTVTGGVDIATGLNFTGTLKLKSTDLQALISGKVVVSPLTTLQSYAGSANLQTLLTNLGLSSETLTKLQATNFDLSTFDPVTDASAKDMAVIFIIQQLANQIEDSLQAVSKSDGTPALNTSKATELAFGAIVQQLATKPLFTPGTATIDTTILEDILDTATVNAETAIADPDVTIDTTVINQISSAITTVSQSLNTLVSSNSSLTAEQLQQKLENNEGGIQDTLQEQLKTPVYNEFTLASYTLTQLKDSSTTNPLTISLSQLSSNLNVAFKLANAKTELNDTIKLAFKMNGSRGAKQEDLNVTVSNININFNLDGSLKTATIPTTADIKVSSTLKGVETASFKPNQDIDVTAANGAISLQLLIDSNPTLKGYYNQYSAQLAADDMVKVTAIVLPITYVVDSSLNLGTETADWNNEIFSGPALIANFKLN